jgi:hypothetical protein
MGCLQILMPKPCFFLVNLISLCYVELARFVVFFPCLTFGWLRARTGFLVAPILSHGSANVFFYVVAEVGFVNGSVNIAPR